MSANKGDHIENLRNERYTKRWERRKEMVMLYEQGYAFSDFVEQLSEKYKMKPDTVERDWHRRKKWLPVLAKIDDKQFHISKISMRIRAIMDAAWQTFRAAAKAKNTSSMVGAVDKLMRVSQHEVDIFQSLGVLEKTPEKIDAVITTAGPMKWEEIPEVKAALEKIRENQQKEADALKAADEKKAAEQNEPRTT